MHVSTIYYFFNHIYMDTQNDQKDAQEVQNTGPAGEQSAKETTSAEADKLGATMAKTQEEIQAVEQPVTAESLIPGMKPTNEVAGPPKGVNTGNYLMDSFMVHLPGSFRSLYPFLDENKSADLKEILKQDYEEHGGLEKALILFKDQVVVDLGAGSAEGYYYAALAKAKGYIAVDKYCRDEGQIPYSFFKFLEEHFSTCFLKKLASVVKPIPGVEVSQDMLTFLQRLPDNSVSILTSGIDDCVLPNDDYRYAVEKEIKRVLDPNGVHINHFSSFGYYENDESIEQLFIPGLKYHNLLKAYVKKK
jgi:hypothetical protein